MQDVVAGSESHKAPRSQPLRVLVVDDERDTVLSTMALLRAEGYEAQGLHDAANIVQRVADFNPDVVILDIAMPGTTGWQAAEAIRAGLPEKKVVLVAISGQYTSGADRSVSHKRGFDFYLMKPCDPHVLLTMLRWVGIRSPFRSAVR